MVCNSRRASPSGPVRQAPLVFSRGVDFRLIYTQPKKTGPLIGPDRFLAERVGFEPTKGYKPLLVFKTSAFNRSATSTDIVYDFGLASANCRRSTLLIQQLEKSFDL